MDARRSESSANGRGGMRPSHRVRPRLVWSGLALAVAGAVLIAVGLVVDSATSWVAGVVVAVIGAGAGARGGVFREAGSQASLSDEMHHVAAGETRNGV